MIITNLKFCLYVTEYFTMCFDSLISQNPEGCYVMYVFKVELA